MIHVEPFSPWHVARLDLQSRQTEDLLYATPEYLEELGSAGPAYTFFDGDSPLLCAGLYPDEEAARLWGFFSRNAGAHFVALYRACRRLLDLYSKERIEASVEANFSQGCRWLELLGFKRRALMRGFGYNHEDHFHYVRRT